ncbi:MAG TPA: Gfo/Idh/MocA family oxidoreductase [Anaerolineaceae bacterium]|jgi:predicted dehydrogenase|nr:Gfo/Idh/MocA family oxidoreductase [Anaerolineaceae bacterium]
MTRVAAIGVGSMGRNHARIYNELPDAELVAVADDNLATARQIGTQFGVAAYADFRQLLDQERPEAVSIAVPTALHYDVALAALEAGVHVLIEKPIAATLEQGLALIDTARRCGRILTVGHVVRFNPAIQALKQKLVAGDLGRIFQIFCRRAGPFPARIRDVGVVVDLAPHDVDIMRFLAGADPMRLYAETEQRIHTEHEDLLFALLRFPEGIVGALEINWLTPTKLREVLVLGERGMFRVDDLTQDLYFYENAQAASLTWPALQTLVGVSEGSMTRFAIQRYEPLKLELQAFLKAARGEAPVAVSGEDGLAALRLALALVESGKNRQQIVF